MLGRSEGARGMPARQRYSGEAQITAVISQRNPGASYLAHKAVGDVAKYVPSQGS
jgi:hypothetical protein